jgi:hypothetical protein
MPRPLKRTGSTMLDFGGAKSEHVQKLSLSVTCASSSAASSSSSSTTTMTTTTTTTTTCTTASVPPATSTVMYKAVRLEIVPTMCIIYNEDESVIMRKRLSNLQCRIDGSALVLLDNDMTYKLSDFPSKSTLASSSSPSPSSSSSSNLSVVSAESCLQTIRGNLKSMANSAAPAKEQQQSVAITDLIVREFLTHGEAHKTLTHCTTLEDVHSWAQQRSCKHVSMQLPLSRNAECCRSVVLAAGNQVVLRNAYPAVLSPVVVRSDQLLNREQVPAHSLATQVFVQEYCTQHCASANLEYALYLAEFLLTQLENEIEQRGNADGSLLTTEQRRVLLKAVYKNIEGALECTSTTPRAASIMARFLRQGDPAMHFNKHQLQRIDQAAGGGGQHGLLEQVYERYADEIVVSKVSIHSLQLMRQFELLCVWVDQLSQTSSDVNGIYSNSICYTPEHRRLEALQQSPQGLSVQQKQSRFTTWFSPLYGTLLCIRSLNEKRAFPSEFVRDSRVMAGSLIMVIESLHPIKYVITMTLYRKQMANESDSEPTVF